MRLQMATSITEAQRRETLLELMENTLKPRKAAADLGMDLIEPARPPTGQQARGILAQRCATGHCSLGMTPVLPPQLPCQAVRLSADPASAHPCAAA